MVGIDPVGSILAGGEYVGPYEVEGIGFVQDKSHVPFRLLMKSRFFHRRYDFIPEVLDPNKPNIDQWMKTNDEESFAMVRQVM